MTSHTCSICLEGGVDYSTKCGHVFHEACLFRWIINDKLQRRRLWGYIGSLAPLNGTCPQCRGDIAPVFDMYNCDLERRPKTFVQWAMCAPRITAQKWVLPPPG